MRLLNIILLICLLTVGINAQEPENEDFSPWSNGVQSDEDYLLIAQIVNPMTGQCSLHELDLVAKGAESIPLYRSYVAPCIPYEFFESGTINKEKKEIYALSKYLEKYYRGWTTLPHLHLEREKDGTLTIPTPSGVDLEYTIKGALVSPSYGMNNFNGMQPSGRSDPRNSYIVRKNHYTLELHTSEGIIRTYYRGLLTKERLLNGKVLCYIYKNKELIRIDSMDPKEQYVYASLFIDDASASTHTGQQAFYEFNNRILKIKFREMVGRTWYGRKIKAKIDHSKKHPLLTHVDSPAYNAQRCEYNERFGLISYDGPHHNFQIAYAPSTDKILRVEKLSLGSPDTYRFEYEPPKAGLHGGTTRVFTQDGAFKEYTYDANLLCTCIAGFQSNHQCTLRHYFTWNEQQWLSSESICDGVDNVLFKRSFEYDKYGNPTVEKRENGEMISIIRRIFSTDGMHLILKETHDEGPCTEWEYLPETNLVLTKSVTHNGETLERETFEYDDCNNLIAHSVITHGCERTTRYTLNQSNPFLHMPKIIHSWDGTETHLTYDAWGNVCVEECYDNTHKLYRTLHYEYDEKGHLLSHTNALGHKALYQYDSKGRETAKTNFSNRLTTSYIYDNQNHLINKCESGEGYSHESSYTYTKEGLLASEKDWRNSITQYIYDPILQKPLTVTKDGATTRYSYDALAHITSKEDALKNVTRFTYSATGKPLSIIYPDGTHSSFRYNAADYLIEHTDASGVTINYSRNALGYATTTDYGDFKEHANYKGHLLFSSTNGDGHTTYYTYDDVGRRQQEDYCDHSITLTYDEVGRLKTESQGPRIITYTYDLADHITSKTFTDGITFSYAWDADDNCIRQTCGESVETSAFDPFGRLISHTDPEGNTTSTYYDDNLLQTTTIDALGHKKARYYNPQQQLVKEELLHHDQPIAAEEFVYDLCNNLITRITHIYEGNLHKDSISCVFEYDMRHRCIATTRAFNTPFARTMRYTYTPTGEQSTLTYPDHITLYSEYNAQKKLISITASDNSLHHTFCYNNLGRLIKMCDPKNDIQVVRTLDPHGNILQETINACTLIKKYDELDRPIHYVYPDGSITEYTYDSNVLRRMTRNTLTHIVADYNAQGHPIDQVLCDGTHLRYSYDASERITGIDSEHFTQNTTYDPLGNISQTKFLGHTREYGYDPLNQLTHANDASFSFDSNYNSIGTTNALNELSAISYDLRGNMLSDGLYSYHWDALNRLIAVDTPDDVIHYRYDPFGRLIYRNEEQFLWDNMQEIGTYTPMMGLNNLRIMVPGTLSTLLTEINKTPHIPIYDTSNCLRALVDLMTQTTTYCDYTAFGELLTPNSCPWTFAATRYDPATQLYYHLHRFYHPTLKHWLSIDPAGTIDGTNLYTYAKNNPLRYCDPTGKFIFLIPLLVVEWGAVTTVTTICSATLIQAACDAALIAAISWSVTEGRQYIDTLLRDLKNTAETHAFNNAFSDPLQRSQKGTSAEDSMKVEDAEKNPDLEEITAPGVAEKGHRTFIHKDTGEKFRFDEAKPGQKGHKEHDHYHHSKPGKNGKEEYFDAHGNSADYQSDPYHIYHPDNVWWLK